MTRSILDDVHGLGAVRKKKLLKHFGSVKRMRAASTAEISAVPGIPEAVAEGVYRALHGGGDPHSREEAS